MRKSFAFLPLAIVFAALPLHASEILILETLDDATVEPYRVRAQIGVEGEEQIDESTLIHGPKLDAAFGIGEWAEIGLDYELLTVIDSALFDDVSGSGDLRLRLKAIPLQTDWGNLGFAVVTKVPTADDGKGLGTDEADVVLKGIYGKTFGDLHLLVNLGAAIQGDPRANASQDDFFLWGIGVKYPLRAIGESVAFEGLWLIAEFEGSVGPEDNVNIAEGEYTDGDAEFRGGLVKELPWFNIAATGSVGLTDDSPDWGFRFVISRAFDLPVMTKE